MARPTTAAASGPQSVDSVTKAWLRCVPPATIPSATSSRTPSMTGTAALSISPARPDATSSSRAWPRRPKPVTSVAAWTASPSSRAASRAPAFSAVMIHTASATSSGVPPSRLTAVEITPRPIGFVSTRLSPGCAPAFVSTRPGCTVPTTASPYFGSASSMEWPPATSAPAARTTSAPPSRTRASSSNGRPSRGHATRFSARTGAPPMAYTSESAFVAAIRPQSYGSSTMGVKKSVVTTRARSSRRRYTAASSAVSSPTSRLASASVPTGASKPRTSPSTVRRSAGDSLHAQPAPCEKRVRRTGSVAVTHRWYDGRAGRLAGTDRVHDAAAGDELHRVRVVAVGRRVHVAAADPDPDVRAPATRGDQVAGLERAGVDVRECAALRAGDLRDLHTAGAPRHVGEPRAVEAVGTEPLGGVAVRLADLLLGVGDGCTGAPASERRRPADLGRRRGAD